MTRNGRYVGVSAAADPSKVLQELPFFHFFSLSVRFGLVKKKKIESASSRFKSPSRHVSVCAGGRIPSQRSGGDGLGVVHNRAVATATRRRAECLELSMLGLVPLALGSAAPPFVVGKMLRQQIRSLLSCL